MRVSVWRASGQLRIESFADAGVRRLHLDGRGLAILARAQPAQRTDAASRTSHDVIRVLAQEQTVRGGVGGGSAESAVEDIGGRTTVCASIALSSEAAAAAQPGGLGVDPGKGDY